MAHRSHTETITLLGLLTALTPLSVDMYLPALPALGLAFSAEPGHVRPDRFGFFFGANALGLIAASQLNIRLTRRFNGDLVIGRVLTIQAAACLLLAAATIGRTPGLYPTAALLFIYVALLGCLYPNTTALAMEPYREKAGSASALLGTLQFTLAATAATVLGATNSGTAMPMVIVLGTSGIAAFLIYRLLVKRGGGAMAEGTQRHKATKTQRPRQRSLCCGLSLCLRGFVSLCPFLPQVKL